jgi:hypothetical protein
MPNGNVSSQHSMPQKNCSTPWLPAAISTPGSARTLTGCGRSARGSGRQPPTMPAQCATTSPQRAPQTERTRASRAIAQLRGVLKLYATWAGCPLLEVRGRTVLRSTQVTVLPASAQSRRRSAEGGTAAASWPTDRGDHRRNSRDAPLLMS